MADLRGGTVENCLRAVLSHEKCNGNNNFFDIRSGGVAYGRYP